MKIKIFILFILIVSLSFLALAENVGQNLSSQNERNISPQQQLTWGENQIEKLRNISRTIQRMLDQARREREIVKTTCLNDKLTQINVTIRSFEERLEKLGSSVRTNDREQSNHHYRLMVVFEQRIRTLRAEAEGCVGSEIWEIGRTAIEMNVDENITQADPTDEQRPPGNVERPPVASGYY